MRREAFRNLPELGVVGGERCLVAREHDVEERQNGDAEAARDAVDAGQQDLRVRKEECGQTADGRGQVLGRASLPVCRVVGEDGEVDALAEGGAEAGHQDGATERFVGKLEKMFWKLSLQPPGRIGSRTIGPITIFSTAVSSTTISQFINH